MRVLLVIVGLAITFIAVVAESNSRKDVPIGYFLVGGAALLAGALWRTDARDSVHLDTIQRVTGILAGGPLTMAELLEKLGDGTDTPEFMRYRKGIGLMLQNRLLMVDDGKVALNMSAAAHPTGIGA